MKLFRVVLDVYQVSFNEECVDYRQGVIRK